MKKLSLRTIIISIVAALGVAAVIAGVVIAVQRNQSTSSNTIKVVAGTNVWGNIAEQIGGDNVEVTSILSDPEVDPHLFEADAKTASTLADAQLIIINGLGYDEFMDKLVSASGNTTAQILTVSEVLKASEDANPHLWYDLPRIKEVAVAIQNDLIKIDPANKASYEANTQQFIADLQPLTDKLEQINAQFAGKGVTYTERVAEYLVEDAGLVDKTPADFAAAVESGSEPTPQQVQAFQNVLKSGSVAVLLYNSQAVNEMTEQVQATAQQSGVGVVGVGETIPPGKTFQSWQLEQVTALLEALQK
jgi:zinc/manganese transport system substrate-binding protein